MARKARAGRRRQPSSWDKVCAGRFHVGVSLKLTGFCALNPVRATFWRIAPRPRPEPRAAGRRVGPGAGGLEDAVRHLGDKRRARGAALPAPVVGVGPLGTPTELGLIVLQRRSSKRPFCIKASFNFQRLNQRPNC